MLGNERAIKSIAPSFLFLSSVAGQIGSQTDPPYSAAKAAVINFAQCAAKDLAPFGVRVNTLCPGMVQTPLNRGVYEAWAREQPESERSTYEAWAGEKIKKLIPLNRWQQPEESGRHGRFPGLEPGTEHHRPDNQRGWRLGDALVKMQASPGIATKLALKLVAGKERMRSVIWPSESIACSR